MANMNCKVCGFIYYEDEYICPNCDSPIDEKLPIDKEERTMKLLECIAIKKEEQRKGKIARVLGYTTFFIILITRIIIGTFLNDLQTRHKRGSAITTWLFIPPLSFLFLVGFPWIPTENTSKKVSNGYGLSRKLNMGKKLEILVYLLIGVLCYVLWFNYLKGVVINRYIEYPAPRLDVIGIDRAVFIYQVLYFFDYFILLALYLSCNIFDLKDEKEDMRRRIKEYEEIKRYNNE